MFWDVGTGGTHASGSYVGLALWAWFLIEWFITIMKRYLHSFTDI